MRQNFRELFKKQYDLVVVGGGITGAGIAREAQLRGMNVLLLEKGDFAQGTSSRSSKLIHGGIRYLANLEFDLVFESLHERTNLFEMAPNLVWPARFVLPVYKQSEFGMGKMKLGMILYDLLVGINKLKPHKQLSANETINLIPFINTKDIKGSFVYSDAYTDDSRLVIETIRSAVRHGATCIPYAKVTDAKMEYGKIMGLNINVGGNDFVARGTHFVSAVGPWTDKFAKNIFSKWNRCLKPSKGVHITLERQKLSIENSVVMVDHPNSRIVFCIVREDMIIVGTTDTEYDKDPEEVSTSKSDIDYLLKMCDQYFPKANIRKKDIIASYAGVRPLVSDGSGSVGDTSRESKVISDPRNITFIAGGKYTNYRKTSKKVVDTILKNIPFNNFLKFNKESNSTNPLNPKATIGCYTKSKNMVSYWSKQTGLSLDEVSYLQKRYYMESEDILNYNVEPYSVLSLEVEHAIRHTMCERLIDFFLRRTNMFLSLPDNAMSFYKQVACQMADRLSWSEDKMKDEIAKLEAHIQLELGWKND